MKLSFTSLGNHLSLCHFNTTLWWPLSNQSNSAVLLLLLSAQSRMTYHYLVLLYLSAPPLPHKRIKKWLLLEAPPLSNWLINIYYIQTVHPSIHVSNSRCCNKRRTHCITHQVGQCVCMCWIPVQALRAQNSWAIPGVRHFSVGNVEGLTQIIHLHPCTCEITNESDEQQRPTIFLGGTGKWKIPHFHSIVQQNRHKVCHVANSRFLPCDSIYSPVLEGSLQILNFAAKGLKFKWHVSLLLHTM